jgi:hypothetical protein
MQEGPTGYRTEERTRGPSLRATARASAHEAGGRALSVRRGGTIGLASALVVTLTVAPANPALAQASPSSSRQAPNAPSLLPLPPPPAPSPGLTLDLRETAPPEPSKPKHGSTLLLGGLYLSVSLSVLVLFPPDNWNGNITPHPSQFSRSWTSSPTWHDGDPWTTNYVGHPVMGSVLYLFARRNYHSPVQAFLFSTIASTTWEYAFEAWYEQPSWSDLLVTSTVGALIGEGRWHLRKLLLRGGTPGVLGQVALFLVDPVTEIDILFFGFRT